MLRRLLMLAVAVGLFAVVSGCRTRCDRTGLFTHGARDVPCVLTGGGGTGCFDEAGQPCPCPPGVPATLIPGGETPGGTIPVGPPGVRPDELHMPAPTERIPPPAIPIPAPGGDAILPPPSAPGVPVKNK